MSALWVAFYSVRGGVGRSTNLTLSALELARRGHRVAVVDFDLESPGLDVLLARDKGQPSERVQHGVVDFLDARARGEPLGIEEIVIPLDLPGEYTGRLFLVPAGRCDDAYLSALDRLDLKQMYERSGLLNPVRQLRVELEETLDPDVVLIDSRTGYSDAALVTLFDLADAAVIVMVPDLQNVERLAPVLQRLVRSTRKPQVLLVANKCQLTPPGWRAVANIESRLRELVPVAEEEVDEVESPFLYKLPFLSEFTWVQRLLPPPVPSDALRQLASRLNTLVQERTRPPVPEQIPPLSHDSLGQRQEMLERLQFGSPSAEDDDKLLGTFVPTRNIQEALKPERWLVRGARGSGRTAVFRMLTERPLEARRYCPELVEWDIIPAHGRSDSVYQSGVSLHYALSVIASEKIIQETGATWECVWLMFSVVQAGRTLPTLVKTAIQREAARLLDSYENVRKSLHQLLAMGERVWMEEFRSLVPNDGSPGLMFVYDEVDNSHEWQYGTSTELSQRILNGLLNIWTTDDALALRNRMVPKILLREDIFNSTSEMFSRAWRLRDVQLRWEPGEIATCIVNRAGVDAKISSYMEMQGGKLRHFTPGHDRDLAVLFDERIGTGARRARTWQMANRRLVDADGRLFPSDFVRLAVSAQRLERKSPSPVRSFEPALISGTSVSKAFHEVSMNRVNRLARIIRRNEGDAPFLGSFRGLQSPFHEEELISRFVAAQGPKHSRNEKKEVAERVLLLLKRLGVIGEWADGRLFVAELYLQGLGVHRAGLKLPQDEPPESEV
ncbi:MinD-like ATPase involved in chromosome partitioning or flagellar assembly [Archangium gephyra]|uniref:MinD-like ATPase involved in chromosome partitioning or flagellar assembly n=1 Tax=Archangium gephyra TaxID=48 RepID=A0AAC8QGV3_9BACT|nr:hypothetical protein [Archangium gephyra]AKJ07240.1 Hypothetical protein AA314_08866 [Archangium gephyra]REG26648.1 MinD-like ATPase involved in chromosome partitioning or flagellar assembly [Archangium gephyra]